MRFTVYIAIFAALTLFVGCAKKPVQAVVPGSIDVLDSWAFRIVADSGASIHSIKTWEQCTEAKFPATISVDGKDEKCDPFAGSFPMQYKGELNTAIDAWNLAGAAGKSYHAGAGNDPNGLTQAVNQLAAAVSNLLTHVGKAGTN